MIPGNFELHIFLKLDELFSKYVLSKFLKSANFIGSKLSSILDKINANCFISSQFFKKPQSKVLTNFSSSKNDFLLIISKCFKKSGDLLIIAIFLVGIIL